MLIDSQTYQKSLGDLLSSEIGRIVRLYGSLYESFMIVSKFKKIVNGKSVSYIRLKKLSDGMCMELPMKRYKMRVRGLEEPMKSKKIPDLVVRHF